MKKILLFAAILLFTFTTQAQEWVYEIAPMYKNDTKSDRYNDTSDRLLIRLVYNAKDSVQVYYRVYHSTTGRDYVNPANDWFPYQAFIWLVMNDIEKLNQYVFAQFDIVAIKQE